MIAEQYGFLSHLRIERGSWSAFQRSVARLFVHRGWPHVAIVDGPGDRGADIIASDENKSIACQSKFKSKGDRAAGKQIVKDVRRAMKYYDIEEGFAVTNTRLSSGANKLMKGLTDTGFNIKKLEGGDLYDIYQNLNKWPANELPPYNYQKEAIDALEDIYREGDRRALLALATGLGKTFVAGKFIRRVLETEPEKRILVLANQRPLVKQFDRSLWKHLPKTVSTHLWHGNEEPTYDSGITIATFQTVRNANITGEEYDFVVVDEAHHAPADSYKKVIEDLDPLFLLGLTATPFREDNSSMEELFGPLREDLTIDIIEALQEGYLTDVDYRLYADNLNWEIVQQESSQNYSIRDLNKKLFIDERDDKILDEIEEVWQEEEIERGIIYCASIKHAERMERLLRDRNYDARSLHSEQESDRENERRLRAFRRGDLDVLTAVDMLNEGVDVPEVDLIVFLRVTHSRKIFLQQLGRGLRLAPDKDKVVVMDLVADVRRVAEAVDIDSGVKGDDVEVIESSFDLSFEDEDAQSFFREYIKDKGQIKTMEGEESLKFP